jgi:DNA-binding CsgD family transcriptional regulator
MATMADSISAATDDARFEVEVRAALELLRDGLHAAAATMLVRLGPESWAAREFSTGDSLDVELVDVIRDATRHRSRADDRFLELVATSTDPTVVDRLSARGMVAALLVPGSPTLRSRCHALVAFDRDPPPLDSTDRTAITIFATLVMSRTTRWLVDAAWQRAAASVSEGSPRSYLFEIDAHGSLVQWPFELLGADAALTDQVHPDDRADLATAALGLLRGLDDVAGVTVRLLAVDGGREPVRLLARRNVPGGIEGIVLPESPVRQLPARVASLLSPREQEIALMIADGFRVRQVAVRLFVSEHTVRNHLKSIFVKLDVGSQADLIDVVRGDVGLRLPAR